MYDVMTREGLRRRRGVGGGVEPRAPPHGRRAGDGRAAAGPGRRASPPPPTSSTTARPTTCGWCSPCSGRPSASARCAATAWRSPAWWSAAGRAAGVLCRDAVDGGEFELCADNVVNATGVWADRIRPDELHDEAEVPMIRPSRGTHVTVSAELLPVRGRRDRARRQGPLDLRPAVARAHPDRHNRQRLRGRAGPHPAGGGGHRLPPERGERVLRHLARTRATSPAPTPACAR